MPPLKNTHKVRRSRTAAADAIMHGSKAEIFIHSKKKGTEIFIQDKMG